ncbi:hypothetical protein [Candidatus Poriferisodalis sp.]|uniref:hypothetical protein n=1 Tax=Candidatus Poriferisodalis sp. TaxID=3101277 RepID=UPI003B52D8F6
MGSKTRVSMLKFGFGVFAAVTAAGLAGCSSDADVPRSNPLLGEPAATVETLEPATTVGTLDPTADVETEAPSEPPVATTAGTVTPSTTESPVAAELPDEIPATVEPSTDGSASGAG